MFLISLSDSLLLVYRIKGLPRWLSGRNSSAMQEMHIQWQPTQVFLPGKSMDRGAWWATVHGVAKESDTT